MSTPEQNGPEHPDGVPPTPPEPVAPPTPGPVAPPTSGWGDSPRYGQYGQPQYGQQGSYGQGVPHQPAPTPYGALPGAPLRPVADKPGIVPLRPLTLGEIYDGAFSAVRHNPAVMLGISTLILLVATVIGVLVGQLLVPSFAGLFDPIFDDPALRDAGVAIGFTSGTMAQVYGSFTGLGLTTLLAGPIVDGVLTVSVSRSVLGDKATVKQVWARVSSRAWVLVGWALLQALGLLVASTALLLAVVAIATVFAQASGVLAVLTAVVLGLGAVAVLAWLTVRLLLVPPALVLEGARLWTTVKRAWLLTRGSFWRTLGIYLLATIIVGLIAQVVSVPLTLAAGTIAGVTGETVMAPLTVVSVLVSVITAAIQVIFLAGVTALLYIDLRMRREGLDVQLTAAAAERRG